MRISPSGPSGWWTRGSDCSSPSFFMFRTSASNWCCGIFCAFTSCSLRCLILMRRTCIVPCITLAASTWTGFEVPCVLAVFGMIGVLLSSPVFLSLVYFLRPRRRRPLDRLVLFCELWVFCALLHCVTYFTHSSCGVCPLNFPVSQS